MDAMACALVGLMCGYALRESLCAPPKLKLPGWLHELGVSVAEQVDRVENVHKFAGEELDVRSVEIYSRKDGREFEIRVKRVKEDAGL